MKRILVLCFFYGITVCGLSQKVELQQAVQIALKNSLDIQVAKGNLQINVLYNYIGLAGALPVISASGSDNESVTGVHQEINTGEVINRSGALANSASASLAAGILLYNGNRIWATKKRLEELELQTRDQLNSTIQNVMAQVMTAYYDVVRQQGYIRTIAEAIAVAQKKLEIVTAQQHVGLANNADLFQSEVDLNNLLQSQQSQQLTIDQAKAELLRQLTLNSDSAITVEDTIMVDRQTISLDQVLANLNTNGDILAADAQVKINQQIIKETAAQRYPTLKSSAGFNYSRSQSAAGQLLLNETNGPYLGVNFSIPIYNGSIYKRQQKAAEINVQIAEAQKEILLRDYRADIVKTYKAYVSTLLQLETQQKNYGLAQQLLDLVLQRFQLHQATIIDLSQAQQSFVTAGYTLVNLNFAAKSAEIELKRISNKLAL